MKYMFMPLRRYADFNGRSRRSEFWLWQLFNWVIFSILFGTLIAMSVSAFSRVEQRGGVRYQSSSSYDRDYDDRGSRSSRDRDSEYSDSGSRYDEGSGSDSSRSSRERDRDRDRDFSSSSSYAAVWNIDPYMLAEEIGPVFWVVLALAGLWTLFTFIPNLAVTIRRLHDTDKSGWMYLLVFIPLIGGIIVLVFMFIEGTRGPNRFGPDPKGPEVDRAFA